MCSFDRWLLIPEKTASYRCFTIQRTKKLHSMYMHCKRNIWFKQVPLFSCYRVKAGVVQMCCAIAQNTPLVHVAATAIKVFTVRFMHVR